MSLQKTFVKLPAVTVYFIVQSNNIQLLKYKFHTTHKQKCHSKEGHFCLHKLKLYL